MYVKEPKQKFTEVKKEIKPPNHKIWFVFAFLCLLVYAGLQYKDVVEIDKNGNLQLSAQRLEKLHKD